LVRVENYGALMDIPASHYSNAESAVAEARSLVREGVGRDAAAQAVATVAVAEALLACREELASIRDHIADPPA
jgi:hypothetical protein